MQFRQQLPSYGIDIVLHLIYTVRASIYCIAKSKYGEKDETQKNEANSECCFLSERLRHGDHQNEYDVNVHDGYKDQPPIFNSRYFTHNIIVIKWDDGRPSGLVCLFKGFPNTCNN